MGASFPHTRGDVPLPEKGRYTGSSFSPHAWGCSALRLAVLRYFLVFPTRVGMFRPRLCARCSADGFPHTRGDVPDCDETPRTREQFSPHAWGCSADLVALWRRGLVFPTRVGMFRWPWRAWRASSSFPHTRGDVPTCATAAPPNLSFSPHAWGCSAARPLRGATVGVFPTRVGMFRPRRRQTRAGVRFPHTRGDVPDAPSRHPARVMFSPHAWGCSARVRRRKQC